MLILNRLKQYPIYAYFKPAQTVSNLCLF